MSDIEIVLDRIRENCVVLSNRHKKNYILLKSMLKYYRIPAIIFSALNVFASVGLQPYIQQGFISLITCGISLITGVIGSIELFNGVQNSMELELNSSKDFYILGIDIYRLLSLREENRGVDLKAYLEEKYQIYCKLIEQSNVIDKNMLDKLTPMLRNIDYIPTSINASIESEIII